jgi:hypothetical protein
VTAGYPPLFALNNLEYYVLASYRVLEQLNINLLSRQSLEELGLSDFNRKFLESASNLKPLIKKSLGREPSMKIAREIAICIQHGRLFYEAAASSPIEIKPLQMFYGMVNFAKALIIARNLKALERLPQTHGLRDISAQNSRLEALKVKIESRGTCQELNDAVSPLNRICYFEGTTTPASKAIPASTSAELVGKELGIKDILSRISGLQDLYKQTFDEESNTSIFTIKPFDEYEHCELYIDAPELFVDRISLKRIVESLRERYPCLQKWCLQSAILVVGSPQITFSNVDKTDIDEFSDNYMQEINGGFQSYRHWEGDASVKRSEFTSLLAPPLGGFNRHPGMVAPFEGTYLSDFSLYYLGMFLLSSVVRYRPQTWGHAISRSVTEENVADDRALALLESFMAIAESFPSMIAGIICNTTSRYSNIWGR